MEVEAEVADEGERQRLKLRQTTLHNRTWLGSLPLTTQESTEEGTDAEEPDDETLDGGLELAGVDDPSRAAGSEAQEEIVHEEDIGDLTSVVPEEESTHAARPGWNGEAVISSRFCWNPGYDSHRLLLTWHRCQSRR